MFFIEMEACVMHFKWHVIGKKWFHELSSVKHGAWVVWLPCKQVYQVFDTRIKAIKEVDLNNANDIIVEGYKNEIKLLKRLQYCDKVIKMYDR